jgi:hypothetical protein
VLGDELAALKADKQEKVLYALWDMGNMKRSMGKLLSTWPCSAQVLAGSVG